MRPRRPPLPRPRADDGFSLVEVLVAATIVVAGVLAAFALLDRGGRATASSLQRDGANALVQELLERAGGVRYDAVANDLVDRRAGAVPAGGVAATTAPLPGTPAQRLAVALDPAATTPAAIAESDPGRPWRSEASWDVRRGTTTYRVAYRACTSSDPVGGVVLAGPFDCGRAPDDDGPDGGDGSCRVALVPPARAADADAPLDVRLQLLGVVGLQVCVGALPLTLDRLAPALCSLLWGSSTTAVSGLLDRVVGAGALLDRLQDTLRLRAAGASVELCPGSAADLSAAARGAGAATRVDVRVSWRDRATGEQEAVRQRQVLRRPAEEPAT